jgi:uncharacterized protein (AIM24 family)
MATPVLAGASSGSFPSESFREAPRLRYRVEGDLAPLLVVSLEPDEWIWFDQGLVLWKESALKIGVRDEHAPFRQMLSERTYEARATGPGSIGLGHGRPGQIVALGVGREAKLLVRPHALVAATSTVRRGPTSPLGEGWTDELTADAPGMVWVRGRCDVFEVDVLDGESIDVHPSRWLYLSTGSMEIVNEYLPGTNAFYRSWLRVTGPARVGFDSGTPQS